MITSIEYESEGQIIEHNGAGVIYSLPIDMSKMNIPEGFSDPYTISLSPIRNMHEFSSIGTVLSLKTTIVDSDNNTKIIDENYFGNFEEQ